MIKREDGLAIGMGFKGIGLELGAQLHIIVNLTIDDQGISPIIKKRLITARHINNGQSNMNHRQRIFFMYAMTIGAAVRNAGDHRI